jgi:hypothetical protein
MSWHCVSDVLALDVSAISWRKTVWAKLARLPDFSALADPLAGVHAELPRVPRDLRAVAGELRRVLVSFLDDVARILEVRPPNQWRAAA